MSDINTNDRKNYNTRQKDEIIRAIDSFGSEHFTVAEVVKKLSEHGTTVGQATVYRAIMRLETDGKLRKYTVDGTTAACYQRAEEHCREHFHLKCEGCGKLIHVECEELLKISSHISSHHGFSVDPSKTVFYGICENCR